MSHLKRHLLAHCGELISQSIEDVNQQIQELRKSMSEETKSSAGDKYETARAMIDQEIDKLGIRLHNLSQQKKILDSVNLAKNCDHPELGAIVETNLGNYLFGIPLGKIEFEGAAFFGISALSPIGKALLTIDKHGETTFNGQKLVVVKIT